MELTLTVSGNVQLKGIIIVAQSVTCLATNASLTADPGVASSIQPGPILLWRLIMNNFYGHSPPFR